MVLALDASHPSTGGFVDAVRDADGASPLGGRGRRCVSGGSAPEMAGTAAALMITVQMACTSLSSLVVALIFPLAGSSAMPATMAAVAILAGSTLRGLVRAEPAIEVTPRSSGIGSSLRQRV